MGDFDTKQAEQRVGTIMGDCLGHYRKHLSGQTAIAFCCSVAHAEAVAHLFQSAGIAAASIDGSMDTGTRRELLQRLAVGDLKVLTSCALIGEGVDVPSRRRLHPAAAYRQRGLHLQMIGRCLRPQPGKTAVVLDHVGNTLRLGHHLEERDWTLDGLKKRDREATPSVKVCPQCFATSPSTAQVCRDCGHVFAPPERRELKQVDGELVEALPAGISIGSMVAVPKFRGRFIGPYVVRDIGRHGQMSGVVLGLDDMQGSAASYFLEDLSAVKPWESIEAKRQQGKATDLEALRELAQQRGYKRGWAERVYQARLAKRHGI
jgi:hypothetical protein